MKEIASLEEFEDLVKKSHDMPVFLFKLSPICSISLFVQKVIEKFIQPDENNFTAYQIDVVRNRSVSRTIADKIQVRHQSPQALLFVDGRCIWNESHQYITEESLQNSLKSKN